MQTFRGRRAASIENSALRVTVVAGGGHIAEVLDKRTGVSPLWIPPWPSIEPAAFDPQTDASYGQNSEARLLACIMGHNLCLDIFGGPSAEEEAAGLHPHGEASIALYDIEPSATHLVMRADLTEASLRVERRIDIDDRAVRIVESVENTTATDRPVAWTEHVTLGPPFLERGSTEFRASATNSKVLEGKFGSADYLAAGAEFDWPHAPRQDGRTADLRVFNDAAVSGGYTAHLMDRTALSAWFVAFSPALRQAFGYVWRQADFPWMGIWEENHSRAAPPWNSATLTRGMEFGVSPFPESRRRMIERARLFGVPTYRWIPARTRVEVEYWILALQADRIPERLEWPR
ncbi:MAG: hypothetical protein V7647_3988 [Acidobacteriota bacterium]